MPAQTSFTPPTFQKYVDAFRSLRNLTDKQMHMLQMHYNSPDRTTTAPEMASALGFGSYSVANAQYGRLANLVGKKLGYSPEPERLGTLVLFEKRDGRWHWRMRPEVARALEVLRWVEKTSVRSHEDVAVPPRLPDIDLLSLTAREGRRRLVQHLRRERNRFVIKAKKAHVLKTTGRLECEVCGFDFGQVYGSIGDGFCEVHHRLPLAATVSEVTTALDELAVLCSNCHRIVHRTNPFKAIEELRTIVRSHAGQQ